MSPPPPASTTERPAREPPSAPTITLPAGSRYFERNGLRAPLLLRNVTSGSAAGFTPLLASASAAGSALVRVQLTQGFGYDTLGIDSRGAVLESWAAAWEAVFDEAERQGLGVIVVFGIWGDWNDGEPALGWTHFSANPLSVARGGPASSPVELLQDSAAQRLWLGWLGELAQRWSGWPNIVAWEIFSELDLVSGASEAGALSLLERASQVLRERDPLRRPTFASTSDLPLLERAPWSNFWSSESNQLISVHPYDPQLDRAALARVRAVRELSDKPILIAESGLDAAEPDGSTATSAPGAPAALESAIWTELFSGAASARGLYWEDGYAAYYPGTGLPLVSARGTLERSASSWLAGKDFSGLEAAPLLGAPEVWGSALGSDSLVLGWARDAASGAPDGQSAGLAQVTLQVGLPAGSADGAWSVLLTNPEDGSTSEVVARAAEDVLTFTAPGPLRAVAFEARR